MPEEAHICLSCLTETEEKTVIAVKDKPLFFANKKRASAIIAAIALIISLIIFFIFYSNNSSNKNSENLQSDKAVVSTFTEEDGSVITEYDDGSTETKEPDGTIVTKEKDGTIITKQTDGTTITEKPDGTVITKKPDGTTEVTEKPTEQPTEKPTKPSTNESTSAEQTIKSPTDTTENSNQPINYDDFTFEYKDYTWNGVKEKKLVITKYTGNSEIVMVPYSYNGEYVHEICIHAFSDKKSIKKIIFNATDNHAPFVHENAIWRCEQLNEISFNWNNYSSPYYRTKTIDDRFAGACDNISNIKITGSNYYKTYENGIYYNSAPSTNPNSYVIIQAWGSEWHQPSWCKGADAVIFESNTAMKEIYINPTRYTLRDFLSPYLSAVHINENNNEYFDDNGVVYNKSTKECCYYPPQKSDKTYTFIDGYKLTTNYSEYVTNSYIETLYIPQDFKINTSYGKRFIKASKLKTIYIQEGNPDIDFINENFKGNVIVYN